MIYATSTLIMLEVFFLLTELPLHAIATSIMFVGLCILWAAMNLEKK